MPKAAKATERKTYSVTIQKEALRQIDEEVLVRQLTEVRERAMSGPRERQGWVPIGRIAFSRSESKEAWLYKSTFKFRREARRVPEETEQRQYDEIKHTIIGPAANARGWELEDAPKQTYAPAVADQPKKEVNYFEHIYGRENQIIRIQAAIDTAIETNFQQRNHCLLEGDPSGGKTQLALAFMRKLGGSDKVMRLDATSMTQAGAENQIIELRQVPRFLIIEEIEKTIPENLRWLIPVLDDRGEIVKTTARANIRKECKLLCIATVNDSKLFKRVLKGAIASRFPNKIFCPYPDRPTLEKILASKIADKGMMEWIAPALDYAQKHGIKDVREIVAICVDGKSRLLDGSYQKALEATMAPKEADKEDEKESTASLIQQLADKLKAK